MLEPSAKRYLTSLFVSTLTLLICVFLINCVVDPLWYFRGNLVTGQNFAFDERLAKLNRFLNDPNKYDCFIFGSSRTTLLDEDDIEGHNCFNFAFSDGRIGEFIAYSSYLKAKGYRPEFIIVAVDGFNFFNKNTRKNVPAYIANYTDPPSFLINYATLGALGFSARTLLGSSPSDIYRYYKSDFSPDILPSAPSYEPKRRYARAMESERLGSFYLKNARRYRKLMQVYPDSEFVFYVPPISACVIQAYAEQGILDRYLKGLHSVSRIAPVLYDFSVPSDVTIDTSRTYDGSHYNIDTNRLVAETINSGVPQFGVNVKDMAYIDYQRLYLHARDSLSDRCIEPRSAAHSGSASGIELF